MTPPGPAHNSLGKVPLLVIVGPTASGKTALSVSLAAALGGEVVNADSVQIYRHFDIGSGKATLCERNSIPHHLIDAFDPHEILDAAQFAIHAEKIITDIHGRGKLPIVCGGTFLWVRALLYGLAPAPPKDDKLRAEHKEIADQQGRAALHGQLEIIDPASHRRLSPNDFVRVSRALEVFQLTGTPLSALHAAHGFRDLRYAARLLGVHHSPVELTARIVKRTQDMLAAGWVAEVRELRARGFQDTRAMQSVGYREVNAALMHADSPDLPALSEIVVQKTRIFARRQRTWLKGQKVDWITPMQAASAEAAEIAKDLLTRSLTAP